MDIAKCNNTNCPRKLSCKRYLVIGKEFQWFTDGETCVANNYYLYWEAL